MNSAWTVHYFAECWQGYLVQALAKVDGADVICDPRVRLLTAYDEEHDGSLLETLLVQLSSQQTAQQKASRLFIHKNTFYYCLGQVRELLGFDPDCLDDAGQLLLSCAVELYKRKGKA